MRITMRNPFKKAPAAPEPFAVPMTHVLRSMIYDAGFENPETLAAALGLNAVSDEVADMERKDSARRMAAIGPVTPYIGITTAFLAKAMTQYASSNIGHELPEEVVADMTEQFQRIALGAALTTLASLNDLGLVHIAGIAMGIANGADLFPEEGA